MVVEIPKHNFLMMVVNQNLKILDKGSWQNQPSVNEVVECPHCQCQSFLDPGPLD